MKCLLFKQEYNFVFIKSQQVIGELIIKSYANFCDMQSRAKLAYAVSLKPSLNVSTTPITAMGYRQCLPFNVIQLKGKRCRKSL